LLIDPHTDSVLKSFGNILVTACTIICGIALLIGCRKKSAEKAEIAEVGFRSNVIVAELPISKEQAAKIAEEEAMRRGWKGVSDAEPPRFDGNTWLVMFWSTPRTPGGFVTIRISTDGKVLGIIPGR